MPQGYQQLDLDERRAIFRLLNAKVPVAAIARQQPAEDATNRGPDLAQSQ